LRRPLQVGRQESSQGPGQDHLDIWSQDVVRRV
jgi:hypothetical protein